MSEDNRPLATLRASWSRHKKSGDICPEWADDFSAFRDWALGQGYASGCRIFKSKHNALFGPDSVSIIVPAVTDGGMNKIDGAKFDQAVQHFALSLLLAGPEQIRALVDRIHDRRMPEDWYPIFVSETQNK